MALGSETRRWHADTDIVSEAMDIDGLSRKIGTMNSSSKGETDSQGPRQSCLPHAVEPRPPGSGSPIALFVYNRPWHTRQTVEALRRNELAEQSDLYVFSDAPRNEAEQAAVLETRKVVNALRGFRSVHVIEREKNLGLAASIIDGVTRLCEKFGQVIVMEDDLVTSRYFLRFMNDALHLYRDAPEVMHVSGGTYPVEPRAGANSYFLRLPLCWGWATWQRAWSGFGKDIDIMRRFDRRMISRFNFDNTHRNYWEQLELNRDGKINTWFVFWYAMVFLRNGLVLFPRQSLIRNIGMDGSGVHCDKTDQFDVEISPVPIELERIPLAESAEAYARHKRYFRSIRPSLYSQVLHRCRRVARRLLP